MCSARGMPLVLHRYDSIMPTSPTSRQTFSRRILRRQLLLVIVSLLLGVIVNITVAWGFWNGGKRPRSPLTGFMDWDSVEIEADVHTIWSRHCTADWPKTPEHALQFNSTGLSLLHLITVTGGFDVEGLTQSEFTALAEVRNVFEIKHVKCGWPVHSMSIDRWSFRKGLRNLDAYSDGWVLDTNPPYELPRRPLWPGFTINTAFYAVILWLLFAAPFAIRRWRRMRKSLCPKCAYPTGTSAICTECGRPVRGMHQSCASERATVLNNELHGSARPAHKAPGCHPVLSATSTG